MRLPKLEKIVSDIAEAKAKIAEWQNRLRALEKLKIDAENDRMIKALRSERISDADLGALVEAFRKSKNKPDGADAPAMENTRLEETRDADFEN